MADYIYTMETRLTPDQLRAVNMVQELARAQGINVYLTGGTVRDLITGFPIRDLDFTFQSNPLRFQKDLEKAGVRIESADEETKNLSVTFAGGIRGEINMAHTARYDKPGKPPVLTPAGINEDLRRRDFTVNAMALSLNPGSRGLFLDPANGAADIEAKVIRILHNYAFLEEPVRLIRATRFTARFHWTLEERTQARYDSAKENKYIEYISKDAIGREIEQLAYEDDPLHIMRSLEKEGWLEVLHPHWSVAKVDANGLAALLRTRQQLAEISVEGVPAAAIMHFLTDKLSDKEVGEIQKSIPNKTLVEKWRNLDSDAKDLAKKLTGKEGATPSRSWDVLAQANPASLMFLAATTRQQAVEQKIKSYFGKWRETLQRFPLPEMAELLITPATSNYKEIVDQAFRLMLDGKLRTPTEITKFLKPLAPPPPPPPPPPKRGRGAKAAEAAGVAPAGKKAPEAPAAIAASADGNQPAAAANTGKKGAKAAKAAPEPVKVGPAKAGPGPVAAKAAAVKTAAVKTAPAPAKPSAKAPEKAVAVRSAPAKTAAKKAVPVAAKKSAPTKAAPAKKAIAAKKGGRK